MACLSHKTEFLEAEALSSPIFQVPGTAPDVLKTKRTYHPRYQPPRKRVTATQKETV